MTRRLRVPAAVLAVVALAAPGAGTEASAATPVVRATAPEAVGFGDAFTYVVVATGDADASVSAPVAPFTRLGAPRVERSGAVVRLTQQLACLDARCLADNRLNRIRLSPPRARVGTRSTAGRAVTLTVRGRVTALAVSRGDEAYRRDTSLPGARAATARTWIALAIAAALLALVALALVPARRVRRADRSAVDAIPRAIRLLRESATRDATDRRRAAALLARVAGARARPLSDEAATAAWARPAPAGDDALRLAARAQRELT